VAEVSAGHGGKRDWQDRAGIFSTIFSPANGSLHFVVPDRLLLFPEPQPVPDGRAWHDAGGARRFSARYYADLFAHLGVRLVLRIKTAQPCYLNIVE
jgi:hypothetical protein